MKSPWYLTTRAACPKPPASVKDWLLTAESLTQRIKERCNGRFNLELTGQIWSRPLRDERLYLGLQPAQYTLIRQVFLRCDKKPLVFARTIIPRGTLVGSGRKLASLGTRPLGDILFNDKSASRRELAIGKINGNDPRYRFATARGQTPAAGLWGRRSLFFFNGKPLLVIEIFLPELCAYNSNH